MNNNIQTHLCILYMNNWFYGTAVVHHHACYVRYIPLWVFDFSRVLLLCAVLCLPDCLFADLLSQALSQFSVPGAVRLVQLRDGLCVLELFHGQTMAFKDLAMACVTRLLDYFLRRECRRATILVG